MIKPIRFSSRKAEAIIDLLEIFHTLYWKELVAMVGDRDVHRLCKRDLLIGLH